MNERLQKERYGKAFFLGFFLMALSFIPFLIIDNGLFIYYGDYNAQQIPFYKMMHEAVRSGNIFWNWQTDLGANTISSYSFYLLGSPFFWLTIPFPNSWVPYLMPFLFCLKYGFATLTSYAYIRRFVTKTNIALIGALLYAFSGFSAYNIFFNHFHDVICFFPLILIGLEEAVVNNRKGCFALSVALMATINYYFFVGQVVFLIIYFILRLIFSKEFKLSFSKFWSLSLESIIGVGIAGIILCPSVLMVTQNPRVGLKRVLFGEDMIYYVQSFKYLNIIRSLFFAPDIAGNPNLFTDLTEKWSSVAAYLPLFSMVGVITFFSKTKKHWIKALLLICGFMAFVPFLNSAFQLFNGAYYARWFYMPVLIMALCTAITLDKNGLDMKFGILSTLFVTVLFGAIGILPKYEQIKDSLGNKIGGKLTFGTVPASAVVFWLTVSFSLVALMIMAILYAKRKSKNVMKATLVLTAIMSVGLTVLTMAISRSNGPSTSRVKNDLLNQKFTLLSDESEQFYRIDTYACHSNANIYWGYPCMQSFHSIIPASAFDYYASYGYNRLVKTDIGYSGYALRGLESVKYSIRDVQKEIPYEPMPGFEYIGKEGIYEIYENKYFIPMGYMYDCYFGEAQFDEIKGTNRAKLYMQGLYLSPEQIEKYGSYFTELPEMKVTDLTADAYLIAAERLRANSCDSFSYDNYGFSATAKTQKAGLMVFSVPYEEGWSATVNGSTVTIENVQNGFMAVLVPQGEVNIRFTYKTPGLKLGIIVSLISLVAFILYLLLWKIIRKISPEKFGVSKYEHLNVLETVTDIKLKDEYALNSASEEIFEDGEEEVKQSDEFLRKKPKAKNAYKLKVKEKTPPIIEEEPRTSGELSEETKAALELLGGEKSDNNEKR